MTDISVKTALGGQQIWSFGPRVSCHDAMDPPPVVLQGLEVGVRALTHVTAVRLGLLVGEQVLLQTLHSPKPAEANGAADRLDGGFAGSAPLVKEEADGVWEVRVAV